MRNRVFLFFQCLLFALCAEDSYTHNSPVLSAIEGDPSVTIAGCLNPISGDYVISELDLIIPGIEPLQFSRSYLSGVQQGREAQWSLFPHLYLHLSESQTPFSKRSPIFITVAEPSGTVLRYKNLVAKDGTSKKQFFPMLGKATRGITNTGHGYIGGQTNIANRRITVGQDYYEYVVICGDGSKRYYRKVDNTKLACLQKERKPNGNWIHYEYNDRTYTLKSIRSTNPSGSKTYASACFVHQDPTPYNSRNFTITTSTHQKLDYFFHLDEVKIKKQREHFFRLNHIARPHLPADQLHYHEIPHSHHTFLITNRKSDHQTIAEVRYYEEGINVVDNHPIVIKDENDPAHHRVKSLQEPVGPDGSLRTTHHITYNLGKYARNKKKELQPYLRGYGYATCFDAYDKKTVYTFNDFFVPLFITKFGSNPVNETFLSQQQFVWNFNGLLNLLYSKATYDATSCLSREFFEYDAKGNIIKSTLIGNISGHNHQKITSLTNVHPQERSDIQSTLNTYSNDDYNLLIKQQLPNGLSYEYHYLPDTNLLTATFTSAHHLIKLRQFNTYNEDHILIETIQDDGLTYDKNDVSGVSQRLLTSIQPKQTHPAINFPEIIEEKYLDIATHTYCLLKKRVLHYSDDCNVIQEDVYDAHGQYAYSLYNTYDDKKRLTSSKDALGRVSSYQYNNYNHLVQEKAGNSPVTIVHAKDVLGREFATKTIDSQGVERTTSTYHDLKNRVEKTVDPFGNTTSYLYDELDHVKAVILPSMQTMTGTLCNPTLSQVHDIHGHPLHIQDPLGRITQYTYTILGHIASIVHPDNTKEIFTYLVDGTLSSHITPTGLKEYFTHDPLGRLLHKKIVSKSDTLLYEESFVYNSYHLLSHTDQKGVKTSYRYDGAGRKIEAQKTKNGECIGRESYEYDSLGRHYKTITYADHEKAQVAIQLFDLANRLIEERQEDLTGFVVSKTSYQYDNYDNKTAIFVHSSHSLSEERFTYDDYKRITSHTDPEGNTTYTTYHDNVYNPSTLSYEHDIISTDPKGRQLKERYNAYNRLVSKTMCNALGSIESEELFFYDLVGNKVKECSRVFAHGELLRETLFLREYDHKDRVITLIQAYGSPLQKVTRFAYTLDGKEQTITQPNGSSLEYLYDEKSRLVRLYASDQSVDYSLTYDSSDQLIQVSNLLEGTTSHRSYNARGQVLIDRLANGLSVINTYDDLGRNTSLTLCDGSQIHYDFDAFHLKKVSRLDSEGTLRYEHHYRSYNSRHQPTEEEAISNVGTFHRSYDLSGRLSSITSPYFSETIQERDSCGLILKKHISSSLTDSSSFYAYDHLDHLIEETGLHSHLYAFDSHHVRLSKDNISYESNELNELLHDGISSYTYTPNGARATKHTRSKTLKYTYDALNRLISLETESIQILFTYDFWHRRLSKTVNQLSWLGYWSTIYQQFYIYDNDSEIGSADSSGILHELKVVGLGNHGDIGGAIAVELKGSTYAPIHDLMGNIVQLIDADRHYVAESYSYSAFGETTIYSYYHFVLGESSLSNPWQYQSKRLDLESGLIFFGRRYYDSHVGSWLSEDPLGFTEGPNLYHFLLGNPLTHVDVYGLSAAARDDEEPNPAYVKPPTFPRPLDDNPYTYRPWELTPPPYIEPPTFTYFPRDILPRGPPSSYTPPACQPQYAFMFINGINTSRQEGQQMAAACSIYFESHSVHHFYNPTLGPVKDVVKVMRLLSHQDTRVIDEFRKVLIGHLNRGSEVFIFAHSCGGVVAYNALETLYPHQREKISIFTFGSAKFIPKDFAKIAVNYVSYWDLISVASNGLGKMLGRRSEREKYLNPEVYDIRWLQSHSINPLKEHSFMGQSYQMALQEESIRIRRKIYRDI